MPVDLWKKANDRAKYGPVTYTKKKKRSKARWLPGTSRPTSRKLRRIQSLDARLWFGKYKGKTIRQVMKADISYLHWLANAPDAPRRANTVTNTPLRDPPTKTNLSRSRMTTLKNFLKTLHELT